MFQKTDEEVPFSLDEKINQTHDDVDTVVGPSVKVEGDFASEGNIVVKGTVCGNVKTSKRLTVENGAKIFANVKAGSAIISGGIKGNVKIDDALELTETAQVQGDINCKVLTISPGALVQGKLIMKGINLKDENEPKEKRRSLGKIKTSSEKK